MASPVDVRLEIAEAARDVLLSIGGLNRECLSLSLFMNQLDYGASLEFYRYLQKETPKLASLDKVFPRENTIADLKQSYNYVVHINIPKRAFLYALVLLITLYNLSRDAFEVITGGLRGDHIPGAYFSFYTTLMPSLSRSTPGYVVYEMYVRMSAAFSKLTDAGQLTGDTDEICPGATLSVSEHIASDAFDKGAPISVHVLSPSLFGSHVDAHPDDHGEDYGMDDGDESKHDAGSSEEEFWTNTNRRRFIFMGLGLGGAYWLHRYRKRLRSSRARDQHTYTATTISSVHRNSIWYLPHIVNSA